ncbi:MAG: tetratricopeptide repeat protein [Chloroflexota bacterium]
MTSKTSRRVAPIIALLVISLGLIVLTVIFRQGDNLSTISTATSIPSTVSIQATSIPAVLTNETSYDFHVSQDQLQIALYQLEAEAHSIGWTAQSHIRAGNLWRDMGDLGRALPHWEAAILEEPSPNLLRQIAAIYLERGEWSIAWERIQVLLDLAPNNAWGLYHGGMIIAPSDPTVAFGYLGRVAVLDNDFAPVAQMVLDVIGDTQTSSDVILRVGIELARAEEWSLAENAFQYASDLYYPFAEATAYVGFMRILQGKNGEATITEAIMLDSTNPDMHYIAGIYWRSAGDFSRSEASLIDAIILDPNNPTYHAELGNTYRAMGNFLDAEVWLQTAVIVSNDDPLFVAERNDFYENAPLDRTQTVIGLAPDSELAQEIDPSALSASGWASHVRGDSASGLALIEQALIIDPDNPRALFDKARVLLETNRTEQALPLLQQLADGNSVFAGLAQGLLEREQ